LNVPIIDSLAELLRGARGWVDGRE